MDDADAWRATRPGPFWRSSSATGGFAIVFLDTPYTTIKYRRANFHIYRQAVRRRHSDTRGNPRDAKVSLLRDGPRPTSACNSALGSYIILYASCFVRSCGFLKSFPRAKKIYGKSIGEYGETRSTRSQRGGGVEMKIALLRYHHKGKTRLYTYLLYRRRRREIFAILDHCFVE